MFSRKALNRPNEMNAVSTKSTAAIFSSGLPICPVYFHLVMPRHVFSPCYACYEHTRGIKGYVTYYLTCYVRLRVQNLPHSLEEIWMGANEQTGGKNRSNTFVLTAFISLVGTRDLRTL